MKFFDEISQRRLYMPSRKRTSIRPNVLFGMGAHANRHLENSVQLAVMSLARHFAFIRKQFLVILYICKGRDLD